MRYLVPIAAVMVIGALGAYIHLTLKEARYTYSGPVIITVRGEGEVTAVPNIATFSFSVYAEGSDAVLAQSNSAEAVNRITEYLAGAGIEDRDIKTSNYNLSPRYEYEQQTSCFSGGYCPPGERVLKGYQVNQTIQVKVRATDKAGELISGVGERGATNISGLQFTIDDEDSLKSDAREQAIADAREKAEKLADDLDVRIVRMSGFWEDAGYGYGGVDYARAETASYDGSVVEPKIPAGENTVSATVNVSYEVR